MRIILFVITKYESEVFCSFGEKKIQPLSREQSRQTSFRLSKQRAMEWVRRRTAFEYPYIVIMFLCASWKTPNGNLVVNNIPLCGLRIGEEYHSKYWDTMASHLTCSRFRQCGSAHYWPRVTKATPTTNNPSLRKACNEYALFRR